MKETCKRLWNDYLCEECAPIDTEEERELVKRTVTLHEKAIALLNKEQAGAVEEYVDALCENQALFAEKAFCKGCEFAVRLLWESLAEGR